MSKYRQSFGKIIATKKSKATEFHSRVETSGIFLEGDKKMTMIRDENGDDSTSVITEHLLKSES